MYWSFHLPIQISSLYFSTLFASHKVDHYGQYQGISLSSVFELDSAQELADGQTKRNE